MFSAKDRTAYRYFHKRAHYLAVIAQALRKASTKKGPLKGIKVDWEHADARRPVIAISSGKEQGLKHAIDIRIHASVPADVFHPATLYPTKSLIRDADEATPTPQGSSSILLDTLHKSHMLHLHTLSQKLSGERTASKFLALWRIWATRRGLAPERGASGWFAAMLLNWVVNGGEIGGKGGERTATKRVRGLGRSLGPWGALRAAWEFLANTDFEASPVFLDSDDQLVPKTEFISVYQDIFVDPSGSINIIGDWEKGDVELLRHHARETLALLEDTTVDRFAEVFLHNQTLGPASFDEYMVVDASAAKVDSDAISVAETPRKIDRLARVAADVARRGLADRARLVHTRVLSDTTFAVGLLLNGALATSVLTKGPAADDEEGCEKFKQLWGDRSELRRFQDGSISESVVWSLSRPEEAARIPSLAVEHLLSTHLGNVEVSTVSTNEDWLSILQVPASVRDAVNTEGSEKRGFMPVMEEYDRLYKVLKNVDSELPLAILHVAPASELLRYSSTFIPHPVDVARAASAPDCISYMPIAEITLQFESSPRWPDDLAAIQKLKLALLDKVARVTEKHLRGVRISIALDANASEIDDAASMEVLMPSGVAFRVRINHEKERVLLQRALEPPPPGIPNQLPQPPRKLVMPALERNIRRFVHAPTHHSSLAPMHHCFPSYSTAARLVKRWASAHMLSPHLNAEALELITARTYLDPGTLAAPASAISGFLRTLSFLASWDWRTTPVFIPLHAVTRDAASLSGRPRFGEEAQVALLAAFEKRQESSAWALITEDDESGTRWTGNVGPVIAGRVAALAKASLELARRGTEEGVINVHSLFTTPLEHYDAVCQLAPGTRAGEAVTPDESLWASSGFRNLTAKRDQRLGFDPVSLLVADIQRLYGDTVLVFADVHGGQALGLIFNPQRQPRAFKPFLGYSSAPCGSLVELNKDAILAEIGRLGKGIITKVQKQYK